MTDFITAKNVGDVIAIHLANGSTVLGKLCPAGTEGLITIAKPMSLIVQGTGQQGQLSISMMPYLALGVFPALDEITFDLDHITLVRACPKQLQDIYIENTSGIALAR